MATALKRYNVATAAVCVTPSDLTSAKSVFIVNPTNAEDRTVFFTDAEISVAEIQAVLVGSATPSVTWTVRYAADRSAAGTEMVTGGTVTTSTTGGSAVTTLNNATVPADNWVWLETTAQSGTVTELAVTVKFGTAATEPPGGGGTSYPFSWTDIPDLDPSDKNVYVSSTGSDSNDGLTDSTPKQTLSAAIGLLTTGRGDRLLLKKGDTWTNENLGVWTKSGVSTGRRMVIGTYGTGARPRVLTGSVQGIRTNGSGFSHVLIAGIEFTSHTYTGSGSTFSGIALTDPCSDVIIEDCYVHNYFNGMVIQSFAVERHADIQVRACTIADIYKTLADTGNTLAPQGFYLHGIDNITVEGCIILDAGWTDDAQWSQYRHACYMQNGCTGCVFDDNIVMNTDGPQVRPGGRIVGNVMSRLHNSFSSGIGNSPEVGGVSVTIEDNVVLEGRDIAAEAGGSGARLGDIISGTFKRNIFANGSGSNARAIWFDDNGGAARIAENLYFEDCIAHNWGGHSIWFEGAASLYSGNTLSGCVFQNPDNQTITPFEQNGVLVFSAAQNSTDWTVTNCHISKRSAYGPDDVVYFPAPTLVTLASWFTTMGATGCDTNVVTYADPDRTLDTYAVSLGLTDRAELEGEMRTRSRDNWVSEYTAGAIRFYINEGFS